MPATPFTTTRSRLGAAAGALGSAIALALATGAGPVPSVFQLTGSTEDVQGPCDEAEHAGDAACAGDLTARGTTVDDSDSSGSSTDPDPSDDSSSSDDATTTTEGTSPASTGAAVASEVRTVNAGDAGSIIVAIEGGTLQLLTASPNPGWSVNVEHASGHEIEVEFRSGSMRVDVEVEIEHGQIRERVRVHDEAADSSDSSGPSIDDESDDSSDPSIDDDEDDDSDTSGPSVDDDSGSGSDSSDGPGHD